MTSILSAVKSTHTIAAKAARLGTSFAISKESLRRLWTLNDDGASNFSLRAGIQIVGSGSTGGVGSNGGSPKFKPFFRQNFDPKENTIAAFITIYKAAMRQATDEQKRGYILNRLGATAQEVTVPKLPTIQTWDQICELLIADFGGELSREVKKDAFLHITFKPKRH